MVGIVPFENVYLQMCGLYALEQFPTSLPISVFSRVDIDPICRTYRCAPS